jgi:hypothetical protein
VTELWWSGHRDPPLDQQLDWCPVCDSMVFDDPTHTRNDHTSPVKMPDGYWTHAGCELDYEHVVAELERRYADWERRAAEPAEHCRDPRHGDYTQQQRTA